MLKLPGLLAAALLWQSSTLLNIGAIATPEHLRYQRSVLIPKAGSGMTCVALDATVLAHTASPAHDDLRLFRRPQGSAVETETPYLLTESGPEPVAATEVPIEHLVRTTNGLDFQLRMPDRPYSELRLRLALHDFVGTATVKGKDLQGRETNLGSLPVFDLTSQGLGTWTSVPIQEASWPLLEISLALRSPDGAPLAAPPVTALEGVAVPPSRERQTLYVPTIRTGELEQRGSQTVATLHVPAHVPVERIGVAVRPGYDGNFAREVTVTARPDGSPVTDTEALDAGKVAHLRMPSGDPILSPIDLRQSEVDATLGATLVHGATVHVAIDNGDRPPLPVQSVALMMRERKLCFFADLEGTYTLRYGDPGLPAPRYDEAALATQEQPREARLGPETRNPRFAARQDERNYLKRHPEFFWIVVLACAGMMGGIALHTVQHRRVW